MRLAINAAAPGACLSTLRRSLFLALVFLPGAAYAVDWQQPTAQELSMTREPAAPDASAIILYREEIADDQNYQHSVYVRLKILSDEGKKYGDVEIPYEKQQFKIEAIAGRTIHSDGRVIAFTGKPYDKMLVKTSAYRYQAKIFSMPDVQVGSILEYRYQLHYNEYDLYPPTWYIQGSLFVRKAHYSFVPYAGGVTANHGQSAKTVMWYKILPKNVDVQHVKASGAFFKQAPESFQVDVENVPVEPRDDYLPPIHSTTYRVLFDYSAYKTSDEFWEKEGKYWSSNVDAFVGPGPGVKAAVARLTAPGDAPEQKLKKFYAEVMSYENTDFTRERSTKEEKAEGLQDIKTTDDIVARRRGNGPALTLLFVAMARAAGMKAYLMKVTSREEDLFNTNILSLGQLDSNLAIVNVDGKDEFFDPGERYCPYGHLRWNHTLAGGMRQKEAGTEIGVSPVPQAIEAKTIRIAKLVMDDKGAIDGIVQVAYAGDPAVAWRQLALLDDQTEVEKKMEDEMRTTLPAGLTIHLDQVSHLNDPSQQLVALFHIQGPLATPTAKRLFLPVSIFEANEKPLFSQPKRDLPIYFHYPYEYVDQVSITFPPNMELESVPQKEEVKMQQLALLREGSAVKEHTVTLSRTFVMASILFKTEEYDDLRSFYSKVAHKDQEQAIFKLTGKEATDAKGN